MWRFVFVCAVLFAAYFNYYACHELLQVFFCQVLQAQAQV